MINPKVFFVLLTLLPACSMQVKNQPRRVNSPQASSDAATPVVTAGTATVTKDAPSSCCEKKQPVASHEVSPGDLKIPDEELLNQDGQRVRFFRDLVEGKTVVISFFFTSCTTVCPLLTATMSRVQRELLSRGRDDVQLISISVDPVTDTPTRLKAWSTSYSAQPGWAFLTGGKLNVNHLLKALRSFTPDPQDHTPMILVGNEPRKVWKQVSGLAAPKDIADMICVVAGPKSKGHADTYVTPTDNGSTQASDPVRHTNNHAQNYFTDVELLDQNGKKQRLYTDLMRGRVLLVNSFFSSCTGVCPVLAQRIKAISNAFPGHLGKDLFVLSISVDPLVDTPERLMAYARSVHAEPGWMFLTGTPENVSLALQKFGMRVEARENHSNLFLIGNDATGLWKKAFSLAPAKDVIPIVADVLNDHPESVMSSLPPG